MSNHGSWADFKLITQPISGALPHYFNQLLIPSQNANSDVAWSRWFETGYVWQKENAYHRQYINFIYKQCEPLLNQFT
jgi:hypothetical protein